MTFEEALFREDMQAVQQASEKQDAAQKEADDANAKANNAQSTTDSFSIIRQEFGLKDGETLTPDQVIEKIKENPDILDEIAGDKESCEALKMQPDQIKNLKNAATLGGGENAEGDGESDNAAAPVKANCATADGDANMNNQQKQAWQSIVKKLNQITGADGGQQSGDGTAKKPDANKGVQQ